MLSLGVHLFLVILVLLLPRYLGAWFGATAVTAPPEVLSFTMAPPFADVDPSSHTVEPQKTPLLGQFDSEARDRIQDDRDTPFPLGGETSTENTVHRGGAAVQGGASAAGGDDANSQESHGDLALPKDGGTRIADAVGSEVALLTGRRPVARTGGSRPGQAETSQPGPGLQSSEIASRSGALAFGDFSFSTTAWEFEPYWAYMRSRLYANWHPPAAYKDYGLIPGGWTMVRAVLERTGALRHAEIIGRQGHASLHPSSYAAMLGASPFRALPADFPEDSLVVVVRFIYQPPGVRHAEEPTP